MMLSLKLEASAGEHVKDIILQMSLVATRIGCMVRSNVNGVEIMIKPGADPREAWKLWQKELGGKRQYKIICAHPIEMPPDDYAPPTEAPRK